MTTLVQSAARGALAAVAGLELWNSYARWQKRREYFRAARDLATQAGRRLVVVGAPHAGFHTGLMPAYDCGDVCVDLHGCDRCATSEAVDLSTGHVTTVADNSAVVFVSCTLEYVSDIDAAWREIMRMAGSASNVLVVPVAPGVLASTLYPGARWSLGDAPPHAQSLSKRPVTTVAKVTAAGSIAALAVLSLYDLRPSETRKSRAAAAAER